VGDLSRKVNFTNYGAAGFASKVRQFNLSFTPGLSPVIGGGKKIRETVLTVSSSSRTTTL